MRRDVFAQIDSEWGPHAVDRFATANDKLLPRYNARAMGPGCEGVDALAQTDAVWRRDRSWCHPPWGLLAQLAAKLRDSGASATVVTPTWRSAPWYQEMLELCADFRVEPARRDLFLPGDKGSRTAVGSAGWSVTVFRIPGVRRA